MTHPNWHHEVRSGEQAPRKQIGPNYLIAGTPRRFGERNLHLTVGTRELTVPGLYQYMVGGGSIEFIRTAGTTPVKGLRFSSKLMEDESHMTLAHPAAFEFMRQYYLAPR